MNQFNSDLLSEEKKNDYHNSIGIVQSLFEEEFDLMVKLKDQYNQGADFFNMKRHANSRDLFVKSHEKSFTPVTNDHVISPKETQEIIESRKRSLLPAHIIHEKIEEYEAITGNKLEDEITQSDRAMLMDKKTYVNALTAFESMLDRKYLQNDMGVTITPELSTDDGLLTVTVTDRENPNKVLANIQAELSQEETVLYSDPSTKGVLTSDMQSRIEDVIGSEIEVTAYKVQPDAITIIENNEGKGVKKDLEGSSLKPLTDHLAQSSFIDMDSLEEFVIRQGDWDKMNADPDDIGPAVDNIMETIDELSLNGAMIMDGHNTEKVAAFNSNSNYFVDTWKDNDKLINSTKALKEYSQKPAQEQRVDIS